MHLWRPEDNLWESALPTMRVLGVNAGQQAPITVETSLWFLVLIFVVAAAAVLESNPGFKHTAQVFTTALPGVVKGSFSFDGFLFLYFVFSFFCVCGFFCCCFGLVLEGFF